MSAPTEDHAAPTDGKQKSESVSASSRSSSNNNAIACSTCKTPQTKTFVLKKCSCRAAQYCNTKCQKKHRKAHKAECRRLLAERKSTRVAQGNNEVEGLPKTKQKKESEERGERKEEKTTLPKKEKEEETGDECPICLEILPNDAAKFNRFTCCGNGIVV